MKSHPPQSRSGEKQGSWIGEGECQLPISFCAASSRSLPVHPAELGAVSRSGSPSVGPRLPLITSANKDAAEDTVRRIKEIGAEAFAVRADVTRPDELRALVRRSHTDFGALDIFVHNALGDLLSFMSPPSQVTLDQWDAAYQCQARAFLVAFQEVAPVLRERGSNTGAELLAREPPGRVLAIFRYGS